MKYKAYMYPVSNRLRSGITNPYLDNFMESTGNFISYLNKSFPSDTGIFNLLKFIKKTDLLFLNWIENLPEKKGGAVQSAFLLMLLRFKKLLGIKVIWTLHNKISHSPRHMVLKKLLFNELLKRSDLIITHSKEGESFAEKLCPGVSERIFYFPHPVVPVNGLKHNGDHQYDILIWGTLAPYKGIDSFLEFLSKNNALSRYRILIAGKAVSAEFFEKIKKYADENIKIENSFVNPEMLTRMINNSKVVLFTYSGNSVLSSGALMDSISHRAMVIGPSVGAFAEMGSLGIIRTYDDFDELIQLLDHTNNDSLNIMPSKINSFLYSHTWAEFSKALRKEISILKSK